MKGSVGVLKGHAGPVTSVQVCAGSYLACCCVGCSTDYRLFSCDACLFLFFACVFHVFFVKNKGIAEGHCSLQTVPLSLLFYYIPVACFRCMFDLPFLSGNAFFFLFVFLFIFCPFYLFCFVTSLSLPILSLVSVFAVPGT